MTFRSAVCMTLLCAASCTRQAEDASVAIGPRAMDDGVSGSEVATFALGCFWCSDAVFRAAEGVHEVTVGYTGGHVADPTYDQVCAGDTGHAEAVRIVFDPSKISYAELLDVFWRAHDPTTLNRQGGDVGTQYRSAVFAHSREQMAAAHASRGAVSDSATFRGPIVTEIVRAGEFYPAEDRHQDYYRRNPSASYCRLVIRPKLEKLGKEH